MSNSNQVRLQKYMAECGVASRRKCEQIIIDGKVKVNGHPSKLGDKINPKSDIVTVKGKKIFKEQQIYYIMLNKPRGYVTTASDELGRKTVMELINCNGRVYPIGRLDKNSEGLLILTNDGEFANALMHPSHKISKIYRVTVKPSVTPEMLERMRKGVIIDGRKTAPCEINIITENEGRVVLEFVLHEGRNRQIRKMCESEGLKVARLKRTAIGPVKLGMLKAGESRNLTDSEVKKLLHYSKGE